MPQFHFSRRRAVVYRPVHHKATADSAPRIHPQNRITTRPCAMKRFSKSGSICVVFYKHGQSRGFMKPRSERKAAPARNMI